MTNAASVTGTSGPLEVKTYRDYLKYVADPTTENAEPTMFARRHGKLYLWPVPDGVCTVNVDYASYHPETFEDILFGPEFNEAIFEGVIGAVHAVVECFDPNPRWQNASDATLYAIVKRKWDH